MLRRVCNTLHSRHRLLHIARLRLCLSGPSVSVLEVSRSHLQIPLTLVFPYLCRYSKARDVLQDPALYRRKLKCFSLLNPFLSGTYIYRYETFPTPRQKDGETVAHYTFHLREGVEETKLMLSRLASAHSTQVLEMALLNMTHTRYHLHKIPHNSQHNQGA